jgi:hypothetical protein
VVDAPLGAVSKPITYGVVFAPLALWCVLADALCTQCQNTIKLACASCSPPAWRQSWLMLPARVFR